MKIQYASDLHLEFKENSKFIQDNPFIVNGDILILAGDIGVLGDKDYLSNPFWDWASKNYKQVIIAYGNHEFYEGEDLSLMKDGTIFKIRENINYYYNCVITFENIDIIVSTLWSHIKKEHEEKVTYSVNDFRLIKYNNEILTAKQFNEEHERCLNFIKNSLKNSKAKYKIIVTHHVPSNLLNAKEFEGSDINDAFTVDLTDFIKKSGVDYWIFGHSHRNINKNIGKTKCLCNQIGYVMEEEHLTFDRSKYFELKDNKCNII